MKTLPTIGITVGDPAGIGPEIVLKACARADVLGACRPVLIGSFDNLRYVADRIGVGVDLERDDLPAKPGAIAVNDVPGVDPKLAFGVESAEGGKAAYDYIVRGVELAQAGRTASLVTAPINKVSMKMAGLGHSGHTEMLADLTRSPWSLTFFTVSQLRVLFLTRHLSLKDALASITVEKVVDTMQRFASVSHMVGLPKPSIALQAMNPHAGEGGLFGSEEIEILKPAIAKARALGIDARGPVPADSVFAQASQGRYDVVLSLYHDIAAGVCKTIDFHGTVSITLGLPFLRFSVDHGTAFDIAGKGVADSRNMAETILRAATYANSQPGSA